jgi:hypothetical protein
MHPVNDGGQVDLWANRRWEGTTAMAVSDGFGKPVWRVEKKSRQPAKVAERGRRWLLQKHLLDWWSLCGGEEMQWLKTEWKRGVQQLGI